MTPLERIALRQSIASRKPISFREFVTSSDYCNITPSPVVLAIIDASEGTPVTSIDDDLSERVFKCSRSGLPIGRVPKVIVVGAGRRGGKSSRIVAPKAIHAAWTVPLPDLAPGQIASAKLIAPKRIFAEEAFRFVRGIIEQSPILRKAIVRSLKDTIVLQRPDGKLCDVTVVAADGKGASGRSRTLVGAFLDEACFFYGPDGYTVNDKDLFDSLMPALIECGPLAQCWITSTPWIEGQGLMEAKIKEDWGHHERALVAARVSTDLLRPGFDMASAMEELDPDVFEREMLAIPLPAGAYGFIPGEALASALKIPTPETMAEDTGAGIDLGHGAWRDNSGLAVVSRFTGGVFAPRELLEIVSRPDQKPSETYQRFARTLIQHGVTSFAADTFHKFALQEEMQKHGIAFVNAPEKVRTYKAMKELFEEGRIALGSLADEDKEHLRDQLRGIVAKPLDGGSIKILAPRDRDHGKPDPSGKGHGHADLVSAFVLALWRVGSCDAHAWMEKKPKLFGPGRSSGRSGVYSSGNRAWNRDDLRW